MTRSTATPPVKRHTPLRGDEVLYLRYVHPRVATEAKALAGSRGWTIGELLGQLLELRRRSLAVPIEYPNVIGEPVTKILDELGLEARAV